MTSACLMDDDCINDPKDFPRKCRVFTGNSNPVLAKKICATISELIGAEVQLSKALVKTFSDKESWVKAEENMRLRDIFVIQSTCTSNGRSVSDYLIELLVMINAFKLSSASKITAVIPYYGYGRQDQKKEPHVPITARLVADLLITAGANRVIGMDFHSGQIQGFFSIPVDNLHASYVMIKEIKTLWDDNLVIVSPDAGGTERARFFAKHLNAGIAIIDKRRTGPNAIAGMTVVGDVEGKVAIIVDDMVDTAGTLTKGADAVMEQGALEVHSCCMHPVLSGDAVKLVDRSQLKSLMVSDSVALPPEAVSCDKVRPVTVSKLLGEAMLNSFTGKSVTKLFV